MGKLLNTYHEVDIHIENLLHMKATYGYIPSYYQLALMKGLAKAQEGVVLYFFSELGKKDKKLMSEYFGCPISDDIEQTKATPDRIRDLKRLL